MSVRIWDSVTETALVALKDCAVGGAEACIVVRINLNTIIGVFNSHKKERLAVHRECPLCKRNRY